MKYLPGLSAGNIDAQVSHQADSMRMRPTENWPHDISDGMTFDGGKWATSAPKIHPIMTDCRWHYYFSHTDNSPTQSVKTHMLPRVCLWNPYSVEIQTDDMVVLMPNPYFKYTNAFHFLLNTPEAERMKLKFPESGGVIDRWGADEKFKVRLRGSAHKGTAGLFPNSRYLGFVLESTRFPPGKCLIFSPKITTPDESAQGVHIKKYNTANIASNVLSATRQQGEDHFSHAYQAPWYQLQTENDEGTNSWLNLPGEMFTELRLGEIVKYEPWCMFHDNYPFILKSALGSANVSALEITTSHAASFPTLQLINNGNGGVSTYDFYHYATWCGSSESASAGQFGNLTTFQETPRKDAPALHQCGTKLLWLDESSTEANAPPLRNNLWPSNHIAFNPTPIAQWNVRPGLVTRSPASICAAEWYSSSAGAWILQLAPLSPQNPNDMGILTEDGKFSKSPLGAALQFSAASDAVMFDLPNAQFGSLSLGSLRHAQLSPYSWHPTYLIGHSLADIHAPYESSASITLQDSHSGAERSQWDEHIGGTHPFRLEHGPRTWDLNSTGLLQIGNHAISKQVNNSELSSKDEILAYDIAFEVNQNLWDHYFLSGMPLTSDGTSFSWKPSISEPLWNHRHHLNSAAEVSLTNIESKWNTSADGAGLSYGFWHNGYLLKNKGAFNINSTSEEAWTAFLSGLHGLDRPTHSGTTGSGSDSIFSRTQTPNGTTSSNNASATTPGGWLGGRSLTEDEIRELAHEIVKEVKSRGPFLSMADFINRRLSPKSDTASHRGAMDAAILRTNLNSKFNQAPFLTTANTAGDNNHPDWKVDPDKQPKSKAWGVPGFLTQGDLLEPLAPAMTVRGDTFIVRAYGESRDSQSGEIMASAYLEAVVERSPNYVDPAPLHHDTPAGSSNRAIAPSLILDRPTGTLRKGPLSKANQRHGRKFTLKSFRWLGANEV